MKLVGLAIAIVLGAACGDEPLPAPLASVEGTLGKMAVNDTSLFAVETESGTLLELGRDGTLIGSVPTVGEVIGLAAAADFVAWVEVEGTGTVVKRRIGDVIESLRTFAAHIIATDEGLFYSDIGLVAVWEAAVPERVATPGTDPRVLDVDATFAYTLEGDTMSVVKYEIETDVSEVLLDSATDAAVREGELAYRTAEGVRKRDLFSDFDRIVGAVPESYACELLMAGAAVMCGKFRALEGALDEPLSDPVTGYAAAGSELYWARTEGIGTAIRVLDVDPAPAE